MDLRLGLKTLKIAFLLSQQHISHFNFSSDLWYLQFKQISLKYHCVKFQMVKLYFSFCRHGASDHRCPPRPAGAQKHLSLPQQQ